MAEIKKDHAFSCGENSKKCTFEAINKPPIDLHVLINLHVAATHCITTCIFFPTYVNVFAVFPRNLYFFANSV